MTVIGDSGPLLGITNLRKTYRLGPGKSHDAVSGLSLEVRAGECLGLLGPNGAGKSTTIQCVSGFYPPTSGTVTINGFDVSRDPRNARKRLGVCHQEETLDDDFNVIDQLIRHASYFRVPGKVATERAHALLERFQLGDKAYEPIENLSGGMKRRLQVARAMISEPNVLVLDEPTTGLDPEVRRSLWDALVEWRRKGTAILLSTHYMEEASQLCDRIAILYQGKALDVGSPEQLVERHVGRDPVEVKDRRDVTGTRTWRRPPNLEDVYMKLTGGELTAKAP